MRLQKSTFRGGEGFLARPRAIFVVWTPKFFWEDFRIYEVSLMWVEGQHPHQKFFQPVESQKVAFFQVLDHFQMLIPPTDPTSDDNQNQKITITLRFLP